MGSRNHVRLSVGLKSGILEATLSASAFRLSFFLLLHFLQFTFATLMLVIFPVVSTANET